MFFINIIKMLGFKCINLYMYLCLLVGEGDLIIYVSRFVVIFLFRLLKYRIYNNLFIMELGVKVVIFFDYFGIERD